MAATLTLCAPARHGGFRVLTRPWARRDRQGQPDLAGRAGQAGQTGRTPEALGPRRGEAHGPRVSHGVFSYSHLQQS